MANAGTYSTTLVQVEVGETAAETVSLIELVGAEERAFYLDPVAARQSLRYVRQDNPTIESQYLAQVEARRMAIQARQRHEPGSVRLHVTDPDLELEDRFTVDGTHYIVDALSFQVQVGEGGEPQASAEIAARQLPAAITVTTYDSGLYDDDKEYS